MQDIWLLTWCFEGWKGEANFVSFAEAKKTMREMIRDKIDFMEYTDVIYSDQEESSPRYQIGKYIENFFLDISFPQRKEDILVAEYADDEWQASLTADSIQSSEMESWCQEVYATIRTDFVLMEDPDKCYNFYLMDPYNPEGIGLVEGTEYTISLRRATDEDGEFTDWGAKIIGTVREDGVVIVPREEFEDWE